MSSLPDTSIIQIDANNKYRLAQRVSKTAGDEWQEMVHVARSSFAVSRKWIDKPYEDVDDLLRNVEKREEFEDVTNCIFHDAVESVARLWLKAWDRFID